MTARVVLVRGPRSSAGGGGGCCGGDVRPFDEGGSRAHPHPTAGDQVAEVYRALRTALPREVAVEVVAPSNWLWLLPALVTDGRRRGMRGRDLSRSVRSGMAACSLVVDGRVLFSGQLPPPDQAVEATTAELAGR